MAKCKYAFDKEDEGCRSCNGVTLMYNGKEVDATKCSGFEPDTDEDSSVNAEEPAQETSKIMIDKVEELKESIPESPEACPEDSNESDKEVITEKTEVKDTEQDAINSYVPESDFATTTELCFMSGASCEVNGVWYKFTCEERRVLKPECNVVEEREKLWATVNNEIDKQIMDVKNL